MTGDVPPRDGGDDRAWAPPEPARDAGGPTLPGYRDLTLIAHGGESRVYRARQEGLDRDVAIKVLLVEDPTTVTRFRRELDLTVALGRQHPNIVTVLATGTVSTGEPCIVMEHHELGSLHERLVQQGPLPVDEVVAAGTVVADALAFAHAQGVLHRDVKPQNVLLLPTSYVLADFGIARLADAGHTASAERFSYRHAAPQVLDGEPPAAADDVWSLGSTLYTLLDGRPPFAALDPDDDTALAYLRRVRTEAPRPMRRDDVPPELRDVIDRCLHRDRPERFADAASVHAALAAIRTEARVWAPPDAAPAPADTARMPEHATPASVDPAPAPANAALARADAAPAPAGTPADTDPEPVAAPPTPMPQVRPGGEAPVIAASALAAGSASPEVGPDEDATLGPPDAGPPPVDAPATADDEPSPPRRFDLRIVAFSVVALLIGVGLSVAVAIRDRQVTEPPAPAPTQGVDVPVWEDDLPGDGDPTPEVNDPSLAADVTLDDRGSAIEVRWDDPSDGLAQFVVLVTEPADDGDLRQFPAGVTRAVLEGVDPDAPRYCVRVLAITSETRGLSDERCVDR